MKAIIFDLDNCLASAKAVGTELYEPAFQAIRAVNAGRLTEEALQTAFADTWIHALDFVAEKHGYSPEMLHAGWEVFRTLEVQEPMQGYPDLGLLAALDARLYLVTSGFRRLQESKIRALGIGHFFESTEVNAIDEPEHLGKRAMFAAIRESGGYVPGEVLVVGDNPESEIEAGNQLGMPTVQTLRPGVERGGNAKYYVAGLQEILECWG